MRRAAVLALALLGCGARAHTGGGADAVLVVRSPVADADVWVDEVFVGDVRGLPAGVALRPGAHRVEVRHDAFVTRYLDLELAPRERRVVDVELVPALP